MQVPCVCELRIVLRSNPKHSHLSHRTLTCRRRCSQRRGAGVLAFFLPLFQVTKHTVLAAKPTHVNTHNHRLPFYGTHNGKGFQMLSSSCKHIHMHLLPGAYILRPRKHTPSLSRARVRSLSLTHAHTHTHRDSPQHLPGEIISQARRRSPRRPLPLSRCHCPIIVTRSPDAPREIGGHRSWRRAIRCAFSPGGANDVITAARFQQVRSSPRSACPHPPHALSSGERRQ